MLKGHAKLQLFDKSGKMIEEVEHDNMITNALDYVIPALIAQNRALNDYLLPLAYNALGGLMLFDNELEEDPANIHFPNKNTHLVAYGGQYSDASNTQRGSFNSSESGETDTGFTLVWDFNTSQANGTIRSLALTHRLGGTCPFRFMSEDMRLIRTRTTDGTRYNICRDPKTQLVYCIMGANSGQNIAPLRSFYAPANIYGVADAANNAKKYSAVIKNLRYYGIVHDYQYNEGSSSNPRWVTRYQNIPTGDRYRDGYDGYAYVVWSPGNSSGDGFFYLKKMKIDDFTFEEEDQVKITLANCQLRGPGNYGGDNGYGMVSNGFAYFMSYDRHKVYKVELANTLNVVEINLGTTHTIYDDGRYMVPVRTGGIRLVAAENQGDGNYHAHLFLISQDGAYTMDRIDRNNNYWYQTDYEAGSQTEDLLNMCPRVYSEYIALVPNYLGTICNLSNPVVKTAAASLKVIYTLTDEVEADPEPEPEHEPDPDPETTTEGA